MFFLKGDQEIHLEIHVWLLSLGIQSPENGFMEAKYQKRFGGDFDHPSHFAENMTIDA